MKMRSLVVKEDRMRASSEEVTDFRGKEMVVAKLASEGCRVG